MRAVSPILWLIRGYRAILSPFLGKNCRFYPSCSVFAQEAFEIHGVVKGAWLTLTRLLRCHPWCEGGYDPVPTKKSPEIINKLD